MVNTVAKGRRKVLDCVEIKQQQNFEATAATPNRVTTKDGRPLNLAEDFFGLFDVIALGFRTLCLIQVKAYSSGGNLSAARHDITEWVEMRFGNNPPPWLRIEIWRWIPGQPRLNRTHKKKRVWIDKGYFSTAWWPDWTIERERVRLYDEKVHYGVHPVILADNERFNER